MLSLLCDRRGPGTKGPGSDVRGCAPGTGVEPSSGHPVGECDAGLRREGDCGMPRLIRRPTRLGVTGSGVDVRWCVSMGRGVR